MAMATPFSDRGRTSLRGRADECAVLDGLVAASARARAGRWCCGARPGSGRRRCCEYLVASASDLTVVRAVGRGVGDGAGLRQPASAVRADARSARAAAGAAASGARDRVRAAAPAPPPDRFLVGLAVLEPALGGGRGASAAVRRRRRAVARSGLGADTGVRRPPPAGGAGRDRVRGARAGRGAPARPRAGGRTACATATPARCSARRCGSCWTSASGTGSSRRRGATRWRCSSCRGA